MNTAPTDFSYFAKLNAETRGAELAFAFSDGDEVTARLSHSALDSAARVVAVALRERRLERKPVLLLLESPCDFVCAFFGCLYAGAIAVPLNLPTRSQRLEKLPLIAKDSGAGVALTCARVRRELSEQSSDLDCIDLPELCATASRAVSGYRDLTLDRDAPAFLQYTSGSTGTPKGVIVSHGNLIANQAMIRAAFGHGRDTVFATWLPLYHDMGLVGTMLQPTYLGIPCTMMPPLAFVQQPVRWLRLISETRATTSGAPNFAYDLCAHRVDPGDMAGIDLGCWRVAFNGAEPVRAETLARFSEMFAPFGFSSRSFYPCYGMAEATLLVSGGLPAEEPRICRVAAHARETGDASNGESAGASESIRTLVSCGFGHEGLQIIVVDAETAEERAEGEVGEIWISGSSVALGYWRKPTLSQETFQARTRDGRGSFLRTGDLGFIRDGELFVTGRIKDLIIVSGKNHYPQDIERTVSRAHPAFDNRRNAALALLQAGSEQIAVVQEVDPRSARSLDESELARCVRQAVLHEHGVALERVLFVHPGNVPMTTSGKVQRSECRALLLAGRLSSSFAAKAHV